MADTEQAKKHATIRVTTVLKKIMGVDAEGNLMQDMYSVFKDKLVDPDAKQLFKTDMEALSTQLQQLGIMPEAVASTITVVL